jgi:hypothetical protein
MIVDTVLIAWGPALTTTKHPPALQAAVLAYLEDVEIEQTVAYARGGRSFAQLTDDELRETWIETMQMWARDPTSPGARIVETDTRAELTLRGLQPPWDVACHALEEIRAKTSKLFESLSCDKLLEIDGQLTAGVTDYLVRRDRPQN